MLLNSPLNRHILAFFIWRKWKHKEIVGIGKKHVPRSKGLSGLGQVISLLWWLQFIPLESKIGTSEVTLVVAKFSSI